VALFLADMGYAVVKHGNRAVSSSCGSADVLEALGLPFAQGSDQVQHQLSRSGFVFLFAPNFHPAFAKLAPLRKDLGVRTVFNLLGPLLNPARPTHQLLGVPGRQFMRPVAEALSLAGIQQAAVVHGAGGFDELTPLGENQCLVVNEGELTKVDIDSRRFGLAVCQEHDLACRDKEQALKVLIGLLKGTGPQAMKDMLTLNLGLAIYLLGQDRDMDQAMRLAGQRVEQGLKREVGRA
jgi:anthranilate phosphoribosyltransferase